MMVLKQLDLFSGIGGFALAARWMGWETVQFVEIDKFCQAVLKKNFGDVPIHGDIKTFDGKPFRGTIDILTGGDPCQPHSVAGLGKGTSDDRFLWPEMFRIAQELNVPWIVNENVSGSIANGVLDLKIDDLESVGYTCQPYCLPAESVGALHQRERVWLVAYNADSDRDCKIARDLCGDKKEQGLRLEAQQHQVNKSRQPVDLRVADSDPDRQRLQEYNNPAVSGTFTKGLSRYFGFGPDPHGNIPRNVLESGIMGMLNGLPEGMDYADRSQRIKGAGNAIVPQVAFEIFKAIEATLIS
jgi:DNA (cytosine-5)-methyltransferase 1